MVELVEPVADSVASLAADEPWLLAIVAVLVVAVVYSVVKFVVSLAVRVGLIAAVVVAGLYTVGYLG